MMQRMGRTGLVLFLCAHLGCSWAVVTPLPPNPPDPRAAECTETALIPLVDLLSSGSLIVMGLTVAVIGVLGLPSASIEPGRRAVLLTAGGATLGAGVAFGYSAGYGFRKTRECRDAHGYAPGWAR